MNYSILNIKNEILQWLLDLEDEDAIFEIIEIKRSFEGKMIVSEPQAEYVVKDDFEERWAKAMPFEESKRRTLEYIRSLPWKK